MEQLDLNLFFSNETIKDLCLSKIVSEANDNKSYDDILEEYSQLTDFLLLMVCLQNKIELNFENPESVTKITDIINEWIINAHLESMIKRGIIESEIDENLKVVYKTKINDKD